MLALDPETGCIGVQVDAGEHPTMTSCHLLSLLVLSFSILIAAFSVIHYHLHDLTLQPHVPPQLTDLVRASVNS